MTDHAPALVFAALTEIPRRTDEIADRAGLSAGITRDALERLRLAGVVAITRTEPNDAEQRELDAHDERIRATQRHRELQRMHASGIKVAEIAARAHLPAAEIRRLLHTDPEPIPTPDVDLHRWALAPSAIRLLRRARTRPTPHHQTHKHGGAPHMAAIHTNTTHHDHQAQNHTTPGADAHARCGEERPALAGMRGQLAFDLEVAA